jgi:hypothetical protein
MEAGIIVVCLVLGLAIWLGARSLDRQRIDDYIRERGGRVMSITWAPFGKGWFGEKNNRIYEVVYYDAEGSQHFATCKTSLWTGVYWTDDQVSHGRPAWFGNLPLTNRAGDPLIRHISSPHDDATAEVQRLREENTRLRAELGHKPQDQ